MRLRIFASLAAAVIAAGLLYLLVVSNGSDEDGPRDLLFDSKGVMVGLSFSASHRCPGCSTPTRIEYAPPDRLKVSDAAGHDAWPFYVRLGATVFVSQAGIRWMTGDPSMAALLVLTDPREMPAFVRDEVITATAEFDGTEARVVEARLDLDGFFQRVAFAELDEETKASLRDVYAPIDLRFWVDADDHRLMRLEMRSPDGDALILDFDFTAPIDVPAAVDSMPHEEAQRLGQEAGAAGLALLKAIGRYEQEEGRYPMRLDAATLAGVLEGAWPANPFTGDQMRNAPDSPGDFSYVLKNGGEDVEFSVSGWDDLQMFYDSARFGPIELP